MTSYFSQSCGLISQDQITDLAAILSFHETVGDSWEELFDGWWWEAGVSFQLTKSEGGICWFGDENFSVDQFIDFIEYCIDAGWITGEVDGQASFTTDRNIIDGFGGGYFRITADNSFYIPTELYSLSNEQLIAIEKITNPVKWE